MITINQLPGTNDGNSHRRHRSTSSESDRRSSRRHHSKRDKKRRESLKSKRREPSSSSSEHSQKSRLKKENHHLYSLFTFLPELPQFIFNSHLLHNCCTLSLCWHCSEKNKLKNSRKQAPLWEALLTQLFPFHSMCKA